MSLNLDDFQHLSDKVFGNILRFKLDRYVYEYYLTKLITDLYKNGSLTYTKRHD